MPFKTDQESLREWFLQNKRVFPWRESITPYKVLVSEVMLQQTRSDVVVDYFNRWIKQFPTIESLAQAPIEQVLKAFEGLGYYSRARNLHKAAQALQNRFPESYEELIKIPGIGPYTASAILSFAFKKPVIAVDANVQRVLSRYFVSDHIKEKAEKEFSHQNPEEIAEGLIELGAVICQKKPRCEECPLAKGCRAFLEDKISLFPKTKPKVKATSIHYKVVIPVYQGRLGVYKRSKGELFADLYMFLEEEIEDAKKVVTPFPLIKATATCYRFFLAPYILKEEKMRPNLEYLTLQECLKRPFSSGHRKILHRLIEYDQEVYCH